MLIGRFAPSPTGYMHLGNARTALLAWLQMRALHGKVILRIEDLDQNRCRAFAYDAIRRDLEWLGLDWDQEYLQSERLDYYQQALDALETYPCSCSRKDIQNAVSAPHDQHGQESIYPGTCRQQGANQSKPLAIRWKTPDQTIDVHDLRMGKQSQQIKIEQGDIVLKRNDGCFAYHLAVVVDDALMGITHILRGEDLWASTPIQVALQTALSYSQPTYLHAPLMRDYQGQRLAKRHGAPSVHDLRQAGQKPEKILADLASSLGWAVPSEVGRHELLQLYGSPLAEGKLQI